MKKKTLILVSLMLFFMAVSSAAAFDDGVDITNATDPIRVEGNTLDDVSDAIEAADEDSIIELEGTYIANTSRDVKIEKSLTVRGSENGAEIDLDGSFHQFNIGSFSNQSKDVTFMNLKFKNSGGVALTFKIAPNSNITFINCAFESANPGFIRNDDWTGGNVNIINSSVSNMNMEMMQSEPKFESFNIFGSRFTDITADGIIDGMMMETEINVCDSHFENLVNGFLFYTTRSNFINNTFVNVEKRALSSISTESNISRNTFRNSHGTMGDYKVYVIAVDALTFENNTLDDLDVGCYVSSKNGLNLLGFKVSDIGARSRISSENLIIDASDFKNAEFTYEASGLQVRGCEFYNSRFYQGDLYVLGQCEVSDCSFICYSSLPAGSAPITIRNTLIKDGSSVGSSALTRIYDSTFDNVNSGFFNDFEITNTNFRNMALSFQSAKRVMMDGCGFANCREFYFSVPDVSITNSRFTGNSASETLIYVDGKVLRLTGNVFSNNFADNLLAFNCRSDFASSTVEISRNIFVENHGSNTNPSFLAINYLAGDDNNHYSEAKSINLADNFYGYNVVDPSELDGVYFLDGISPSSRTWVNLMFESAGGNSYRLRFADNAGNTVALNDYSFSVRDKGTGEILASNVIVKNGVGEVDLGKALSLSDVEILTESSTLVNRPSARVVVSSTGSNYDDFRLVVRMYDEKGNLIKNANFEIITYYLSSGKVVDTKKSTGNTGTGVATVKINFASAADSFNFRVRLKSPDFAFSVGNLENVKISKVASTVSVKNLVLGPGKAYTALVQDAVSFKPETDGFVMKIYKGSKLIKTHVLGKSYAKEMAKDFAKLSKGKYKVVLEPHGSKLHTFKKVSFKLTIAKKAKVKAPKVTSKYKKSKYFKVTVKLGKKALKKVSLRVKVFTGKKYKIYKIKTNRKGVAKLNVKKLKRGKHNVVVTSSYAKAFIYKTSKITIK